MVIVRGGGIRAKLRRWAMGVDVPLGELTLVPSDSGGHRSVSLRLIVGYWPVGFGIETPPWGPEYQVVVLGYLAVDDEAFGDLLQRQVGTVRSTDRILTLDGSNLEGARGWVSGGW